MEFDIKGVPSVHFDFYPSNYVLNNDPSLLISNPYLTRNNIWEFKAGLNQGFLRESWGVKLVS